MRMSIEEAICCFLTYDEETGILRWSSCARFPGRIAGNKRKKGGRTYLEFTLCGKRMSAHKAAWFIMYGCFAEGDIDHEDGDGTNNRKNNLRDVTRAVNLRNACKRTDNKSGATGVRKVSATGRWRAEIRVDNCYVYLGAFGTFEEAKAARKTAEELYGFSSRHGEDRKQNAG